MKSVPVSAETFDRAEPLLREYPYPPYFYHHSLEREGLYKLWIPQVRQAVESGAMTLCILEDAGEDVGLFGIERMQWDCDFFGNAIGRVYPFFLRDANSNLEHLSKAAKILKESIASLGFAYVTIAFEFHDMPQTIALQEVGFKVVDGWITWGFDFEKMAVPSRKTTLPIRPFDKENGEELEEVVAMSLAAFQENNDRFHNDPFFSDEDADRLYEEWTRNSLMVYDRVAMVCECEDFIGGYITAKIHKDANTILSRPVGELELAAVSVKGRGRGIYTDLFIAGLEHLRDKAQVHLAHEKTQIGNFHVQNAWKTLGLRMIRTAYVSRLHLLENEAR